MHHHFIAGVSVVVPEHTVLEAIVRELAASEAAVEFYVFQDEVLPGHEVEVTVSDGYQYVTAAFAVAEGDAFPALDVAPVLASIEAGQYDHRCLDPGCCDQQPGLAPVVLAGTVGLYGPAVQAWREYVRGYLDVVETTSRPVR